MGISKLSLVVIPHGTIKGKDTVKVTFQQLLSILNREQGKWPKDRDQEKISRITTLLSKPVYEIDESDRE